jgi:hypothetical protein
MRRPWRVVVVRAWQLDSHWIIRMTMSSGGEFAPCSVSVTSSRSAADQLARWLDEPADQTDDVTDEDET